MSDITNLRWRRCAAKNGGTSTVFRRPLGIGELLFYWDTVFNGIAITISHMELEAAREHEDKLFSKSNIELAWTRMKQRFPLLAASVDELPGSQSVEFELDENSLHFIRPGEVVFMDHLESVDDVTRLIDSLQNGPPFLTNEIIAKVLIGPQKDLPRVYHAFVVVAHHIMDGISGMTLMRELCQEIASLSKGERIPGKSLQERLSTLVPMEILNPNSKLSLPRRRWRSATAKVIHQLRKTRTTGGHTLPTTKPVEPSKPAASCTVALSLPAAQTRQVINGCRAQGITFGNALPVLSQLAQTRVLYRCRKDPSARRPGVSDDDWEYRRMQPMHFPGPISLRPYLDRKWYDAGGASDVCMAIGFYDLALPIMPSPRTYEQELFSLFSSAIIQPQSLARWLAGPRDVHCYLSDGPETATMEPWDTDGPGNGGAPSFSSLLSPQRFLARARMVQSQNADFVRHPLLLELQIERMRDLCHHAQDVALAWRSKQVGGGKLPSAVSTTPNAVPNSSEREYVMSHGGASLGNRDLLLPLEYPLPSREDSSTVKPRLHIRDNIIHLRCRPGELYLGALTSRGQLTFFAYVDARVYDMDIVHEWLEDVRAATVHYLGGAVASDERNSSKHPATITRATGQQDNLRARL